MSFKNTTAMNYDISYISDYILQITDPQRTDPEYLKNA